MFGIPGNSFSLKSGGFLVPCQSSLERRFLRFANMEPSIVEIRGQYPIWDRATYAKDKELNLNMLGSAIKAIDFCVTLKKHCSEELQYMGVSCKYESDLDTLKATRRHEEEIRLLRIPNFKHIIFTEKSVSRLQDDNNLRLQSYMHKVEKIEPVYVAAARELARRLHATKATGSLDRVLGIICTKMDLNRDTTGYRLFSLAHYLGFLRWDHRFPLDPILEMKLEDPDIVLRRKNSTSKER
ncbi:hypothetical protein I5R65_21650 [Herbaspirillum sp. AP02]|uniref:TnsA endonuclease N-terminal domain-containing protein n=1 Tax=unclassified Herbaspirillum TaxID=2624150 RepID=UPI0018C94795|nr:hypothetical protein [Herbaspirillum sp. AP02]